MSIEIHPIQTAAEYRAVELLQQSVWGAEAIEIIPHDLLITAHKNGGVVLGAFDSAAQRQLVGFVFGFLGMTAAGQIKHCSHIAGVAAGYQNLNIGYQLKLAQRTQVLIQGINLITWTFDPLESRNARFNFYKLGVTCNTFLPNLYGAMRDTLNAGLPSDRFQVDWAIASSRVNACLNGDRPKQSLVTLRAVGVEVINPASQRNELLCPSENSTAITGEQLLLEIPADFQKIKATDAGLAYAWRMHTRLLFEQAFASGYTADNLLVKDGRSYYMLERLPATAQTGGQPAAG